ncbi:ferric reductase-like transmembrane domain-containing protein [Salinimicrobium tongyeongense]|uniref:Ferric reductase-like transmembrane domain-containing protein n=1 Tax=Salinimicrobium tongyeongense TaxID=2809707 RepID=A0ABY6NMV4_9FLAO|nr:ferric reductase-like transmembrane domain-containing protein [Salinimicrobium tongyeongense]UZH54214.1 ferric reductase-like transmembrane domain-containing protein [Salinimicrobium tongyeongense]
MLSYQLIARPRWGGAKKDRPGKFIFWGVALLAIPLWMLSYPATTVKHNATPILVYASQLFSLTGFALFALSLMLTCRFNFLETWFGGLDKVYKMHRRMGKVAFFLILAHPVLLALRWIPQDVSKALWYLFPLHRRLEIDLGSWALWGMTLLIIFTLLIKIPYHRWKLSHKFMGFFFILGVAHIFFQGLFFSENVLLGLYLSLLSAGGIAAWLYKSVLFDLVKRKSLYSVSELKYLNDSIIEIELEPKKEHQSLYRPGQFYFFSFLSEDLTAESHPFTLCDRHSDGKLKIMVKSLGDYTHRLYALLKPNTPALLEGPYGRFCLDTARKQQLWLAGGVGIAPFLSWANYLLKQPDENLHVNLYYCVKNFAAANQLSTFEALEKKMPHFHLKVISRETGDYFHAKDHPEIMHSDIFICGPKRMRKTICKELKSLKVPAASIHTEEFDFD